MDRRSVCQFVASVVGFGSLLIGLRVIMGRADLAPDGSLLAASVVRATFNAGRQLDVTNSESQHIAVLVVMAVIALAVDSIGTPHSGKALHDHTDSDPLSGDDPPVIADP